METIINYLSACLTKGVGAKTVKSIIEIFGSLEAFFSSDIEKAQNLKEKIQKNISKAEKLLKDCEKQGIKLIHLGSPSYPKNLRQIPDPPPILFVKGNLNVDNGISVVGTRKPTTYGKSVANALGEFLGKSNIPTISGGALGIDTIIHKASVKAGTPTCVVLGSGLNLFYPYENKKLFETIIENGGAIVSEFLPDTKPSKYNFPKRNRIIAGLSLATVVVEAPEKSGSLITAELANQYGRHVFAIPHRIDNKQGLGCNKLIKDGATILTNTEDLQEEVPYLFKQKLTSTEEKTTSIEEKILSVIEDEIHIDELTAKVNLPFDKLMEVLFELEMEGKIVNNNGFIEKRGV